MGDVLSKKSAAINLTAGWVSGKLEAKVVCHLQFQRNLWWHTFLEVRYRYALIGLSGIVVLVCQIFDHLLRNNRSGGPTLRVAKTSDIGVDCHTVPVSDKCLMTPLRSRPPLKACFSGSHSSLRPRGER